jgi:hypothetical protein
MRAGLSASFVQHEHSRGDIYVLLREELEAPAASANGSL